MMIKHGLGGDVARDLSSYLWAWRSARSSKLMVE